MEAGEKQLDKAMSRSELCAHRPPRLLAWAEEGNEQPHPSVQHRDQLPEQVLGECERAACPLCPQLDDLQVARLHR